MRNTITLFILAMVLGSCSSVKRSQKSLNQGQYDQAISLVTKKLKKGNDTPRRDAQILILEEAYSRVNSDDLKRIDFLKKDNILKSAREIYNTYLDLEDRQRLVQPLLPLFIESEGRNANIKRNDYANDIVAAKNDYIVYLYAEADSYMQEQNRDAYRTAYNIYCELDELQRNYKDVTQLRKNARFYGTDFVFVTLNNRSGQIIPRRLERELLDFNTYGLDEFWTEYHSVRQTDIDYNYGIAYNFREILISPERISEETFRRKKLIKDGWEYKLDRNGNVVKDSLGNDIKIDKETLVRASVTVTQQTKGVAVGGNVVFRDLLSNREIGKQPLASEFVFENVFARFRGDERALTGEDISLLENDFVQFPSNEQMVFDAGEDVKQKLASILQNNSF